MPRELRRRGLTGSVEVEPNKKAEGLLLSVLDKAQRKSYKEHKAFEYHEKAKRRTW